MNHHPELLRDSLENHGKYKFDNDVFYLIKFNQIFEDDGWPHIMERFEVVNISIVEYKEVGGADLPF